jgi:hypothetical protein
MISPLGFEEIVDDLFFPPPGTIPVLSPRQNHGVTIGYRPFGVRQRVPPQNSRISPTCYILLDTSGLPAQLLYQAIQERGCLRTKNVSRRCLNLSLYKRIEPIVAK